MIYFFMFLALLSGALDGVNGAQMKKSRLNPFKLTGRSYLGALPLYWIWILTSGAQLAIPLKLIPYLILQSALFTVATVLWIYSQRISGLTRTLPYLTFTPAILLFVSPIIDGSEIPKAGYLGVVILSLGLYVFNIERNGERFDLLAPARRLTKDRGAIYMLLVAIIYSVNASMDKLFSRSVDLTLWLSLSHALTGFVLIVLARTKLGLSRSLGRFRRSAKSVDRTAILSFSLILGVAMVIYCIAVPHLIPPFMISLRRAGIVFIAFVLGLRWFAEHHNLKNKLIGAFIMLAGMIIIVAIQ